MAVWCLSSSKAVKGTEGLIMTLLKDREGYSRIRGGTGIERGWIRIDKNTLGEKDMEKKNRKHKNRREKRNKIE